MGAEILAGLRGIIGNVKDYSGNPLVLYAMVLIIYFIYRRTSS